MIYRVCTKSREYFLTGAPGIDITEAFTRFEAELPTDAADRDAVLASVLAHYSPDETPFGDDLLGQAFIACLRENADVYTHLVTTVTLGDTRAA